MNKEKFIKELANITKLDNSKCIILNNILEDHFLFGKNNKKKIVSDIKIKLNVTDEKAEELYELSMSIISSEIKNKLKHPFKNQD